MNRTSTYLIQKRLHDGQQQRPRIMTVWFGFTGESQNTLQFGSVVGPRLYTKKRIITEYIRKCETFFEAIASWCTSVWRKLLAYLTAIPGWAVAYKPSSCAPTHTTPYTRTPMPSTISLLLINRSIRRCDWRMCESEMTRAWWTSCNLHEQFVNNECSKMYHHTQLRCVRL